MTKDVIVLAADKDMEATLKGIFTRHESLKISSFSYDIFTHPNRDAGCLNEAEAFLRSYINQYRYALVVFDYHGCGQENNKGPETLQQELENSLQINGWENDRASVVVIDPELEIWVWSDSNKVDQCLGWSEQSPNLRDWLKERGLLKTNALKPDDPKTAFRDALRKVQEPLSPSLFNDLAKQVSFNRCRDASFQRLCSILKHWFPEKA